MRKTLVLALTLAAATTASLISSVQPATAADAMMKPDSMMKMDCTQADSMMGDAVKSAPPAATGDVDKDFMMLVMDREKGTAMLLKIEASCGKDPKMKAMAAKQSTDADARMAMFRNQSMSQ